jgi:acylphosphatase
MQSPLFCIIKVMKKNITLKIHGEVQGVGFRDAAYWKARELSVFGFVMNEPDGIVYIEAEGEKVALEKFLAWCQKGPITAKVSNVDVIWADAHGKFTGFRIG